MTKTELHYTLQNLMWAVNHDASDVTIAERSEAVESAIRRLIRAELVACNVVAERNPID